MPDQPDEVSESIWTLKMPNSISLLRVGRTNITRPQEVIARLGSKKVERFQARTRAKALSQYAAKWKEDANVPKVEESPNRVVKGCRKGASAEEFESKDAFQVSRQEVLPPNAGSVSFFYLSYRVLSFCVGPIAFPLFSIRDLCPKAPFLESLIIRPEEASQVLT
jgi:hypothetical protein